MGEVRVQFLGEPVIVEDGRPRPVRPLDAAVCFLVARRSIRTRAALLDLVWPHMSTKNQLLSLRQLRWRLKTHLGPLLPDDGERAEWRADVGHDGSIGPEILLVDRSMIAEGPLPRVKLASTQAKLIDALHDEQMSWASELRSFLARAANEAKAEGRIADLLAAAELLHDLDPTSIEAAASTMEAFLALDRPDVALAVGARHSQARQDARLPKSERALALEHSAEQQRASTEARWLEVREVAQDLSAGGGRVQTLARLLTDLEQHEIVVLTGPAGIGKSHLFRDAVRLLQGRRRVVRVGLVPEDRMIGLQSLRRLVAAWRTAGIRFQSSSIEGTTYPLGWLFDRSASAPRTLELSKLTAALTEVLLSAGPLDQIILAIDDLHFVDSESAEVISGLLDKPLGVRWLLTARDQELSDSLETWFSRPSARMAWHALGELNTHDIERLLLGTSVPARGRGAWAEALLQHCGGHPWTLTQVLRALQDASQLADATPPPRLPLPGEAVQRIARLLERSGDEARRLVFAGALYGGDFSTEAAVHMFSLPGSVVASHWFTLQRLGIFDDNGFAHELGRKAVLDLIPSSLKSPIHHEIARSMRGTNVPAARRARHWKEAQSWNEAALDLAQAAREYRKAGLQTRAREVLIDSAKCYELAGKSPEAFALKAEAVGLTLAVVSATEALREAQALLESANSPRERCEALILISTIHTDAQSDAGHGCATQALELSKAIGDPVLRDRALLKQATALFVFDQSESAVRILDELRERRTELPTLDAYELVDAHANTLAALGRRSEAMHCWLGELKRARLRDDRARIADLASNAALDLAYLGHTRRALAFAREAAAIRRQVGSDLSFAAADSMTLSGLCQDAGLIEESLQIALQCVVALRGSGLHHFLASAEHCVSSAYLVLGRRDLASECLAALPEGCPEWVVLFRDATRIKVLPKDSAARVASARAMLERLENGSPLSQPYAQWILSLELARDGDPLRCVEIAQHVAEWSKRFEHLALLRHARAVECEALTRSGNKDIAAQCADALVTDLVKNRWQIYNGYLPEYWRAIISAWDACGRQADADSMALRAQRWIRDRAKAMVNRDFARSFLTLHPTNEFLLRRADAARAQGVPTAC